MHVNVDNSMQILYIYSLQFYIVYTKKNKYDSMKKCYDTKLSAF